MNAVGESDPVVLHVADGIIVDQVGVGRDARNDEVGDPDHIKGRETVAAAVSPLEAVDDGERRVEDQPVAEVVLRIDLHLDDEVAPVVGRALHVNDGAPGIGPETDLLLGREFDGRDMFLREDGLDQAEEQILIARRPEDQFECVVDPRINKNNALCTGLAKEFGSCVHSVFRFRFRAKLRHRDHPDKGTGAGFYVF